MSDVYCKRCGTASLLARDTAANGRTQVFNWCVHCRRVADPQRPFVSLEYVTKTLLIPVDSLPVIVRYPNATNPVCEYRGCQSTDTEYHHWGPRHLFEDAEHWPGGYLCTVHHKIWHDAVTPNMCRHNGHPAPVKEQTL